MQFENVGDWFACAGGLGVLLGLSWIGLYLLCWVWCWAWAWIDDCDTPSHNPLVAKVMELMGYEKDSGVWAYKKIKEKVELKFSTYTSFYESDGERGFFYPLIVFLVGPSICLIAFVLYPLTIGVVTAFALAHLARFARRHKKLFDKHIKDPDAHK